MSEETMLEQPTDIGDSATAVASKEEERMRLQAEIDAFLQHGGKIEQVADDVLGDPPQKPSSNYGSQPI